MSQQIISGIDSHKQIASILERYAITKFLLVCGNSFQYLPIKDFFLTNKIPHVRFSDFTPNPVYEAVYKGVQLFREEKCDAIIAVGGGSAMDTAKCIKLYSEMDDNEVYLKQAYQDNDVLLLAVPTTSGSGSESTRYAVIYYNGEKQSVTHDSIIPRYAILDPSVLRTLPLYQKKCTMLDALCQAIEAWWSVNSTDESKEYSKKAISLITTHSAGYLANDEQANLQMLLGANYAGRAINITQSTAAHAMSYKLTALYNLPHGHAVAISLPKIWRYMANHIEGCIDVRGEAYLTSVFTDIAHALGQQSIEASIVWFEQFLKELEISFEAEASATDLELLVDSVNQTRLKNNPVLLESHVIRELYREITS